MSGAHHHHAHGHGNAERQTEEKLDENLAEHTTRKADAFRSPGLGPLAVNELHHFGPRRKVRPEEPLHRRRDH